MGKSLVSCFFETQCIKYGTPRLSSRPASFSSSSCEIAVLLASTAYNSTAVQPIGLSDSVTNANIAR